MNLSLLFIAMLSMALIIAAGCVFNNYIDQDIDAIMERTKNRPMVVGSVSNQAALTYGTILATLGFVIIYLGTNLLTTIIALIGLFSYVVMYSLFLKRYSTYGTIIGGIAGAVPPVVGYCAVTNQFDMGAFLLFIILFTWQIPHFYAISIYRLDDFKKAGIPILPIKKSLFYTKVSMLLYIVAFSIAAVMLVFFTHVGKFYFFIAFFIGLIWIVLMMKGFWHNNDEKIWAKSIFKYSILAITILCFSMIL